MEGNKEGKFITMLFISLLMLSSLCRYLVSYLRNALDPYSLIFTLFFFYCLVAGIFSHKQYFNKNLFQSIGAVILGLMWIYIYIMFSQGEDYLFFVISLIMSLLFVLLIFYQPIEWGKNQKKLESDNEVME